MDEPLWLDEAVMEVIHADQIAEHGGSLADGSSTEEGLAQWIRGRLVPCGE